MKKIKKIFVIVGIVAFALAMISAEFSDNNTDVSSVQAAGTIALSKKTLTMYSGNKQKLTLKNAPDTVKWVSNNKKVATVSQAGEITAKKAGTTNIVAKCKGKVYKCKLTVKKLGKSTPQVVNSTNGITVTWTKVKNATGYYVYRSKNGGAYKKVKSLKSTTFVDKAVAGMSGVTFRYAVCAYRGKSIADKNPKKIIRLNAPVITEMHVENYDELVFDFTEVKGAASYQIKYTKGQTVVTTTISSSRKSYTIKHIEPNDSYSISMRSGADGDYSEWSEPRTYGVSDGVQNYSINECTYGPEDVCWSWWSYPQLVTYKGIRDKAYFGYVTSLGYIGVGSYDMGNGAVVKTNLAQTTPDDHNSCSVSVLDDGRIMAVFASGHDKDKYIHVRVSSQKESITKFNKDIRLTASGKTSYSQVYKVNGIYYIFYRTNSKSWNYYCSRDLQNWEGENKFITAPVQYYMKLTKTTKQNVYRLTMTGNPTSGDCNIRMGFVDFTTGNVYNSDMTPLGKMGNAIDATKFNIIIPQEQGKYTRLFDVAETDINKTEIAYCKWNIGGKKADYSILRDDKTYSVATQSDEFWLKYFGGISFINQDYIVVSYGNNATDHVEIMKFGERTEMEEVEVKDDDKHTATDASQENAGKNTKFVEKTVIDYSSVNEISTTKYDVSTNRSVRPVVDVNGRAVMWQYGYYNSSSYNSFNMDARFSKLSQND